MEGRGEMVDLVDEVSVLILLLYRWLERGVEFLSSVEAVLKDAECEICLLHPVGDEDDDPPPGCLHLGG